MDLRRSLRDATLTAIPIPIPVTITNAITAAPSETTAPDTMLNQSQSRRDRFRVSRTRRLCLAMARKASCLTAMHYVISSRHREYHLLPLALRFSRERVRAHTRYFFSAHLPVASPHSITRRTRGPTPTLGPTNELWAYTLFCSP